MRQRSLKSLIEDQQKRIEELFEKQQKRIEELFEKQQKLLEDQQNQLTDQQNQINELRADLRCSRCEARKLSYRRMLDAYLNIIKFAKGDEPFAKKLRNSKQFQNKLASMRDEALLFSEMLGAHKGRGDELDDKEIRFLDVFSKFDDLCSVGNLRL
jgi:hypothetical protein